ncbi:B-cell receptor CD22 [Epinephelus fuscoguttatus]|uniref:B-cell receptor CD22 n=1 Tax=Epinephelus fuscoguttatus TaxID=293821 RepID=UPI0020D0D54C|nr:B-cell receptor CD22 [Epinephelus fuscoguttatus]
MNALTVGWFVILALIKDCSCAQPFFTTEVTAVTGNEGSCVEIKCKVSQKIKTDGAYWFWIKNSTWSDKDGLLGTVIYSTNYTERPVNSDFEGRVKYTGSPPSSWRDVYPPKSCNILICNLSKTDNGDYLFRFVGKEVKNKWKTDPPVILTVIENPCPLTFKKPPILNESDIITLTCSTSSSCPSNPEIEGLTQLTPTLTSKPQQIEEKQKSTTVRFPVDWQDDGKTFSCKVLDDKYLIQNISITVEYGPRETQANKSLNTVVENKTVTLTCSAKGRPDPTFIWFKNEQKEMTTGAVLEIPSIKESQGGEYHCEAQNTHGKQKSKPVNINVEYLPEIEKVSAPSVVKQGDKMTLTCNVKRSNPQPTTYWWFLNGTSINQTKTHHYVVERIKPEDRGLYRCKATNTVGTGEISPPCHIDVQYGPRKTNISMGKEDNRVKVGESLTFTCITDANPAAEMYSWYRFNTNKQTDSLQWKSNTTYDSTLYLGNVQRADEAYYMCNATNRISTGKNSEQVYIQVLYPPTIPNLSMDTEVKEGQLITITCTVESFPLSELTLTRTSSSNPQRPEVFVTQLDDSHPNTLNHTFNVTSAHTGSYVCEAKSSEGLNRSETRTLVVKYHPKNVTVQATPDFVVDENRTLTLQCSAHSQPQVTSITWMKMVNGKNVVIRKTRSFDLKSVSPSDRGWYSCAASNEIGTGKSQQAEVKVRYPPKHTKITRAAEQQDSDGTSSVTLSCSSDSYPEIKQYFWYKINKNKKDEKVSERQNFTVYSDQPGSYYCIAKNEVYERLSSPVHMFDRSLLKAVLIVIVLLILLIFVIVFFYRHRRRKSVQQRAKNTPPCFGLLGFGNGAKRRNQMNHPGTAEPFRSRDDLLPDQPRCQPPPDSTPASNISTVYCTVNLPPGKQGPSAPKPVRQQGGQTQDDSLNYASLYFGNEQKNKQAKAAEDVYAMVSKHKPPKKIEEKLEDYENVNAARTAKAPDPLAYDTDTSEDEVELNYSQVNFTAKPGHQRARRDSSSSDEDKTQYSEVKL